MSIDWAEIQRDVAAQLERAGIVGSADVGLDRVQVESHARAIAAGELSKASNVVAAQPRLASHEHVESLENLAPRERLELERLGSDAIARGRVAVAVLNGGMATRFGGDVKGIIPAVGGRTFLELKLGQARRLGGRVSACA
jgi:UTP--glucose-1-phosphate uridylyltransferase